jgi:hypothetical protein
MFFNFRKGNSMEIKTLKAVLREMRVDAWNTRTHSEKQYVLCGIQSAFLPTGAGGFSLPTMYVNAQAVCQVSLIATDQVRALSALLAEAKGLKAVDIRVTVSFANTTCYLQGLEILKISLVAPEEPDRSCPA